MFLLLSSVIHSLTHVFLLFHAVPTMPTSFSLMRVSGEPQKLMASWSPPNRTNGIITAYTIYCQQVMNSYAIFETTDDVLNAVLNDLQPFMSYSCYATANTSVGEGPPSNSETVMTDEAGELHVCVFQLKMYLHR